MLAREAVHVQWSESCLNAREDCRLQAKIVYVYSFRKLIC